MKVSMLNISLLLITSFCFGQVGINKSNPASTLDINGDMKTDGSVYLEAPGESTTIRNSKLLIVSPTDNIVRYDIDVSKYGPINYAEFVFRGLSKNGLHDYDTKISTDKYIVSVQGFYYLEAVTDDTDIMAYSNISTNNVEGFQVYAYANPVTNTWFLRAFVNNSEFRTRIAGVFAGTPIDMYLNLIIYRNGFITKERTAMSIDMGNSETGIAPLPTGF
ncbi:hypothetical protein [Ulvibacter antarcticus]|uniref:Uncharacterized protein n=1 Tax=Ulvibacter antarcticus TaxID=442714 RepID=A0A3L9Z234_9FLAO|nr:hypothetical protein [Ulvibacter antarcticus]RMA64418.1 hypothetical protein BXY75_1293 [Ulvibacter antarcticus]